jgi:hypothetical protein
MGRPCADVPKLDQIIVGGESGPRARPFDVAWARDVIRQCRENGAAPFIKQLGRRPYDSNVNAGDYSAQQLRDMGEPPEGVAGAAAVSLRIRDSHGADWSEWSQDIRVREFPNPRRPS